MSHVAVLGSGSWGTALALHLARKGAQVSIWSCEPDQIEQIGTLRENRRFLPGHLLPDSVSVSGDMEAAVEDSDAVVFAVPSGAVREVGSLLSAIPAARAIPLVVNAAKGLEGDTGLRLSEVLRRTLPTEMGERLVVLSGPNLAVELANEVPTATVVASPGEDLCRRAQELFRGRSFRVYWNRDVAGVELGGALKNVIAIGAGIGDGLGYGDNTKATLITRGLAEMTRLGVAMGAQSQTFQGLSGVGDLMATCASKLSRNLRLGMALGRGLTLEEAEREVGQVAEGAPTCRAAYELSHRLGIYVPIIEQVHHVCFEGKDPVTAVIDLMLAEPKSEFE